MKVHKVTCKCTRPLAGQFHKRVGDVIKDHWWIRRHKVGGRCTSDVQVATVYLNSCDISTVLKITEWWTGLSMADEGINGVKLVKANLGRNHSTQAMLIYRWPDIEEHKRATIRWQETVGNYSCEAQYR